MLEAKAVDVFLTLTCCSCISKRVILFLHHETLWWYKVCVRLEGYAIIRAPTEYFVDIKHAYTSQRVRVDVPDGANRNKQAFC